MLNDLNTYFGRIYNIEGKLIKEKVKCLSLINTNKAFKSKLTIKHFQPDIKITPHQFYTFRYSLIEVITNLANYYLIGLTMPVLNETSARDDLSVDIELSGKWHP